MNDEMQTNDLGELPATFGKEVHLQETIYENGFPLLRLRIKERKRFTDLELDPVTAMAWGKALTDWAQRHPLEEASNDG
jgi:hypothetical protein